MSQTLALIPHPLLRQLLPHVGDYLPCTATSPYRAETFGSADEIHRSLLDWNGDRMGLCVGVIRGEIRHGTSKHERGCMTTFEV